MLTEDIKNVLTFAAFKPVPDDPETSWGKRFAGRRSLLLNISRNHVTWRALNKRGRLQDSGMQEGEFADVVASRAEEWRSLTEGGWCSISLNNRFIISLETNLSRCENFTEMLRLNPKTVLGGKFDRSKRYALYHHADTPASVLMACDDSLVKTVEDTLRANNLKAGRMCCGLFALLEEKLREIHEGGRPEAKGSYLLIVCCEGSVAALVQQAGQWTDLRSRSGVGTETVEPVLQIVSPLVSKIAEGTPVFFAHDGNDQAFAGAMMEELSKIGAKDITTEDQLWKTIGQN